MANCPICQTEYIEETVNFCPTCGWDLKPYPLILGQIPEAFLEKQRSQLNSAKQIWRRVLDTQEKLNQAEAEAPRLQLTEVLTKLSQAEQFPAQQVTNSLANLTENFAQFQQQLTQAQEERRQLLSQLTQIPAQFTWKQQEEAAAKAKIKNLSLTVTELSSELKQANTEISRLRAELDKFLPSQLEGGKIYHELSQYESQLKAANRQIVELTSMLETERRKWQLPERKSERGVNFRKLEWLLVFKSWEEADKETWQIILAISGNSSLQKGYLEEREIENISVADLKIVDEMWKVYSNGQYGFSSQWKSIKNNKKSVLNLQSPSQQGYYPAGHIISAIGIKGLIKILMKLSSNNIFYD